MSTNAIVGMTLLVVIGLLAVAAGAALRRRVRLHRERGIIAPATVVDIAVERTPSGGQHPVTRTYYYAVVAYRGPDGRELRGRDRTPHSARPYPVGASVSVNYLLEDPVNFAIAGDPAGTQAALFWLGGGGVLVLAGLAVGAVAAIA